MKCTKMLGWLVMAAALSFTACSSEDDLTQEPTPQQQAQTIHISVGAGIDPATTRSTVDYSNGVRTLQFTTGDRLYVWGSYGEMEEEPSGQEYYPYIIAGYLDLDSDSFDPSDPTNATFTGDLTVYEWTYEVGDYEDEWNEEIEDWEKTGQYFVTTPGYYSPALSSPNFSTNDPLADFENVTATLLHKDAVKDDDYGIIDRDLQIYYRHNCATTVEELMTTQLTVSGVYDPSTKSFALTKNANQPILNCTIAGLEDGVSYKVDYIYGATAAMSDHSMILYSSLPATSGTLSFAFFAKPANYFHGIRLTNTADANDTYTVSIGQKAFDSKVYNATRTAIGKKTPLTIEAITDGSIVVENPKAGMKYKKNNNPKTEMTGTTTINLKKGEKVQFYGNGTKIKNYLGTVFLGGTAFVKVYGNIMSLVDEEGYATATGLSGQNALASLFWKNDKLTDASGLLLPATNLDFACYYAMFADCTSLTTAPQLPATTLATGCYAHMFQNCTSLTTAPELPATTLVDGCYQYMFQNCTSLTTAPLLPAKKLVRGCYNWMFKGCTNLSAVTCLATTGVKESNCTEWLSGVAASGTFTRAIKSATKWTTGENGIPEGWTVVDAQ